MAGEQRFGVEDAILLAAHAHDGQEDKAGRPYILHPLRVMSHFDCHDEAALIVAVLHDVVEDTPVTISDLLTKGIRPDLAEALDTLTHRGGESNENYWARVRSNELARRVKLADIADNSSPKRLGELDGAEADRLGEKYAAAARALTAEES